MEQDKLIEQCLNRGVEEIIDRQNLEKKLKSGRKLKIKLGIDPTSANIHLGRSIPLLKMKDFQDAGHELIFIIGDFTGVIGDTSDKDSERPMLSSEVIEQNMKTYINQAAKIIDIKKARVEYNSKWLGKLTYKEIGEQANAFSLNEFISRDNISRRLEAGKRVSLRELLYPLMQGFDSVKLEADVEIGGTDQRFNLLAGRTPQRLTGQEPQDVITNPLIEGLDGRKMSSSFGNSVNLMDEPNDMFGKIMSLKDEYIIKYFTLLTRVDLEIIKQYEQQLADGLNPREVKLALAQELVRMYHSQEKAEEAKEYFIKTISNKEIPEEMEELKPQSYELASVLVEASLASSKTDAKRTIEQGGVKVNGEVIKDFNFLVPQEAVVQKGKFKFVRLK